MGLCDSAYDTHLLPGWEESSIALHTDEGSIFHSSDNAIPLNKACKKGDIVKVSVKICLQDPTKVIVDFFCNRENVYQAQTALPEGGFYGIVGLMSVGERIKISRPIISKQLKFEELWEVSTPRSITHHGNGVCSYSGVGDLKENSIGTIRSKSKVDHLEDIAKRTLEVRIINPGESRYIAIGVVSESYPTHLFPGWEEPSIGYHADNGNLFHGTERVTNRPCKANDLMRCTLDPIDNSPKRYRITFFRNQIEVGQVTAWTPLGGFYFCVGMMSRSEQVNIVLPELAIPYNPPSRNVRHEDFWEELTLNLVHSRQGVYEYVGQGGQEFVGSIRSKQPLVPFNRNCWFEMKILNAGNSCYIALGVCSKLYSPNLLLGWEDLSVGFHADNGLILQSNLGEIATSHPCKAGDVIRCTVECIDGSDKQVKVLFHRNGILAGSATFWKPTSGFYAQVGCMSGGESVKVISSSMGLPVLQHGLAHPPALVQKSASQQADILRDQPMLPHPHGPPPHPHIPPGHLSRFGMGAAQLPYDPRSFYQNPIYPPMMHYQTASLRERFHPEYRSHGTYMHMHHPFAGQFPGQLTRPPLPFNLPMHSDLSASYPVPTRSPSQPRRQISAQEPSSIMSPTDHLKRLMTHPQDTQTSREGVLSLIADPTHHLQRLEDTRESEHRRSHPSEHLHLYQNPPSSSLHDPQDKQLTKRYPDKSLNGKKSAQSQSMQEDMQATESTDLGHDTSTSVTILAIEDATEDTSVPPTVTDDQPLLALPEVKGLQMVSETITLSKEPKTFSAVPKSNVSGPTFHTTQRKSAVRPPLISQVSVCSTAKTFTKDENKHFKILHEVRFQDSNGPFENSLSEDKTLENAFVVSRLPLSEKNPYFEVEIKHIGPNGNIAIGLIWDNYPVFHLPGALEGSIAFHSLAGSVLSGGSEVELDKPRTPISCNEGDVIGCRAVLNYKSEVSSEKENSIVVQFYFNGCLTSTSSLFLPPAGFFPAIGLKGYKSRIKFSQNIQLSPETYFETHPIPKDYRNFPSPPHLISGWRCLKNAEIRADNMMCLTKHSPGSPGIIQNHALLSRTSPYFELELEHSMCSYSVLAIGATPKVITTKKVIPGEALNSVGYLPLFGFIMKSGSISSTIPEKISSDLLSQKIRLGIGIDFAADETNLDSSCVSEKLDASIDTTRSKRVKVFFTINSQQVCCIFTILPEDGLYPCLAIDSDSLPLSDSVASVHFPAKWPPINQLPLGFVRGYQTWELKPYDSVTFVDSRAAMMDLNSLAVRAIQAAVPLSPSHPYYEIRIINGGQTFKISCGLAPFNYSLSAHPGWQKESIGLHADDSKLFHNSNSKPVCPPIHYRGTIIGCGLRFPESGQPHYAEVFFTVNRKLVATKLVKIPQLGYYPTIGVRTKGGIVSVDLSAPSPLPEMKGQFRTAWGEIQNMKVEGNIVQLASHSEPGAIIQAAPLRIQDTSYFRITPLTERSGRILIGFSTSKCSPLNFLRSNMEGMKAYAIDIATGVVLIYDHYFQTKESFGPQSGAEFGCGLLPQPSMNKILFYCTVDGQAVSYTAVDEISNEVYPFLIMMDSHTQVLVDMCALWPTVSPVGQGWARHANVKLHESKLTHTALLGKKKFPVGFLQSSTPLTQFSSYFDVEVCSRATDKAIAIGLASTRYPMNSWVGWGAESIAYHLDDGKLFKHSSLGHNFGPKAFTGDTVGCGLRFGTSGLTVKGDEKLEVYFTFNGGVIGTQKVTIPTGGLFPTVCIESPSESIVFNQHNQFPPVSSMVCDSQWSNAYCVVQSGQLLQSSQRSLLPTKHKGFCQSKSPFTPCKSYFEVLITGCKEKSQIQVGLCSVIPHGCTTPNTYGVLYSMAGQIFIRRISRNGTQTYTSNSQRASIGDRLGCMVIFKENVACNVEFYLNRMKVSSTNITGFWISQLVYPTIILATPEDSVIPFLSIPKPVWDPTSLTGWLRSERVLLRGRVIEYTSAGRTDGDVGVAQVSQALQVSKHSYFEIEVLDTGEKCTIGIGLAPADYPLGRHPGWERDSIGYHGDDGRLFQYSGSGHAFGPSWKKNDVVGLGIRSHSTDAALLSEVQVYFTRNGDELGHTTHKVPASGLFPTIGMHSSGEKVKIKMNSSVNAPCNIEPGRSFWRTLCGINVTSGSEDSQILTYRENGREISKIRVMTSLATAATPFSSDMQYFEVNLLGVGPVGIAVGVVPNEFPLDHATGWTNGSVAYHTDDGCLYTGSTKGNVFGPVPHKGEGTFCDCKKVF